MSHSTGEHTISPMVMIVVAVTTIIMTVVTNGGRGTKDHTWCGSNATVGTTTGAHWHTRLQHIP